MALSALTNATELIKRLGTSARVDLLSDDNAASVVEASQAATDAFASAARNRYTDETIDALTPDTISKEAKFHIESKALYFLTNKPFTDIPDSIRVANDDADRWLSFLAAGKVHMDALDLLGVSGYGAGRVSYGSATRQFSSTNDAYVLRKPTL